MKVWLCQIVHSLRARRNKALGEQLRVALTFVNDEIPCFIVCYNNPSYVAGMVRQLNKFGLTPIVFDNASTCTDTNKLLDSIHLNSAYVLKIGKNLRHKVGFLPGIYEHMPNIFAYTDPDLKFDDKLPSTFLETLRDLTDQYAVFKAGLALEIKSDGICNNLIINFKKCKSIPFKANYSILEWETVNQKFRLQRNDKLEVYAASVDTTFAVYNKGNYGGSFLDAVRFAGDFKVMHLPWYPELDTMGNYEKDKYLKGNKSSTWVVDQNENSAT